MIVNFAAPSLVLDFLAALLLNNQLYMYKGMVCKDVNTQKSVT